MLGGCAMGLLHGASLMRAGGDGGAARVEGGAGDASAARGGVPCIADACDCEAVEVDSVFSV